MMTAGEELFVGRKKINHHIVWDYKIDRTIKIMLVAGGHLNKNVSKHITYSSAVLRESIGICFLLLAALNSLGFLSDDIGNAFLNTKPREMCHVKIEHDLMFGIRRIRTMRE